MQAPEDRTQVPDKHKISKRQRVECYRLKPNNVSLSPEYLLGSWSFTHHFLTRAPQGRVLKWISKEIKYIFPGKLINR